MGGSSMITKTELAVLSRNSSDGKLLHRTRSSSAKRCLPGSLAGLQRNQPSVPEDIYLRLERLEDQLAAEQQLRLEAQSRLVAVEHKFGSQAGQIDEVEFQRRFEEMRPRFEDVVQQIISSHVERIESRIRGLEKSTGIMEQAVAELSTDLEMIIVDRAVKEAKTEANKEIQMIARQLSAYEKRLESLEASLQAADSAASQRERQFSSNEDGISKQLQAEVRDLKQSYEQLAAQLPGFESRRQAEADAVQAKLKSLISKLDNSCPDVFPDCKTKGAGTTPKPVDSTIDSMSSIQKLKDQNLRFREQNA